ncbi:hypothetical protein [Aquimarina agarivorans]|uniref:hypothetical protein n=1 Tax=Aquimarina agarivorans TaxID=980584 RepID=UPI000248E626|nr:hypothetical protein [Aquimarina agarivorans]
MKNLLFFLASTLFCTTTILGQTKNVIKNSDQVTVLKQTKTDFTEAEFEEMKNSYLKNPIYTENIEKRIAKGDKGALTAKKILSSNFDEATEKFGKKK